MTAADPISTPPRGPLRQNLLIGVLSVLAGAVVIPYGASMPYIREGIPGPGLFPMMIGGLLILFGVLLPLSTWIGARREGRRRHRAGAGGGAVAPGDGDGSEAFALPGAAVQDADGDTPVEALETAGVMDTDVGSDGPRRWINGAILLGGILAYVLLAPVLGFPITMALLVIAIVRSLRASWLAAVLTGVLASLGLWGLFEQVLLVQLPDGLIRGF
ncbi:MAG TPA: tripartite tricarboxylate transporter TctB family protein [Candidatus Brachybacterium intestinipullorum]|uniref:Tripartite tricarboxylate transporter TctB family protein n=1 Tax=Candidatus Brachybacterium intestinipullorum TaxID=2838512 RepID=A0A9D2TI48_9MICO|nr:tripartite tricarboxylate transporter TctB family protein [Candidatus Brachybacterium intestinipullorum]